MEEIKLKTDTVTFAFVWTVLIGKLNHVLNIFSTIWRHIFVPLVNIPFCHIPYPNHTARNSMTFYFNHSFRSPVCIYLPDLYYIHLNPVKLCIKHNYPQYFGAPSMFCFLPLDRKLWHQWISHLLPFDNYTMLHISIYFFILIFTSTI